MHKRITVQINAHVLNKDSITPLRHLFQLVLRRCPRGPEVEACTEESASTMLASNAAKRASGQPSFPFMYLHIWQYIYCHSGPALAVILNTGTSALHVCAYICVQYFRHRGTANIRVLTIYLYMYMYVSPIYIRDPRWNWSSR
jgi:hypothetical protein